MDRKTLAEQKFRPLKKAMQQSFAAIKQALRAGGVPAEGMAQEFLAQARIMTSYPGFGDAAYPELLAASEALAAACARGDGGGAQAAVQALVALQNRCHQARHC